jgi:predicted 2-oxoglutarate/Fe(II)-dependent dioxygenase YbiX
MIKIKTQPRPAEKKDWSNYIFIQENVIDIPTCEELINFGLQEGKNYTFNTVNSNVKFKTCLLPVDHSISTTINSNWEKAIEHFGASIEFIEQYEIKCYNKGCFFGNHFDNMKNPIDRMIDRKLTCSIQLSNEQDYQGGDLLVLNTKMPRTRGTMIVFPSMFMHNVSPVVSGTRCALITWAWGPTFRG